MKAVEKLKQAAQNAGGVQVFVYGFKGIPNILSTCAPELIIALCDVALAAKSIADWDTLQMMDKK